MGIKTANKYLQHIADDGDDRAAFVESLRAAASMLDGSGIELPADTIARVGNKIARDLRFVAQRLCDHARTSHDGSCRYCETLLELE